MITKGLIYNQPSKYLYQNGWWLRLYYCNSAFFPGHTALQWHWPDKASIILILTWQSQHNSDTNLTKPAFWWPVTWLGWWTGLAELGRVVFLKSSSISSTLDNRDLEEVSFMSSSFILLAIMMVFLVIFSPGLLMWSNQGNHCRNTAWTQSGISWVSANLYI